MDNKTHQRETRVLLPASPADQAPERPMPFVIAFLLLMVADIVMLYRLAETPGEFLAILGLLAITFLTSLEALARL